jgi:hypothetical protein
MQQLPRPVGAPRTKVVIHDPPRGEIMGQPAPGTPTPHQIEHPVEDLALGVGLGASAEFGLGHEVLNQVPCVIAAIGRIRWSSRHTPSIPDPNRLKQTF